MEVSLQSALSFLLQNKLFVLLAGPIIYVFSIAIYRRFFHPLAKIPGPLPAAITAYYHLYYNRRLIYELDRLHEEYGPIVRIGPNEVHLADVEHYDTIYHVGSKYNKWPRWYNAMGLPQSAFGSMSMEAHRIRRGALNPFFSRAKVLELESIVQEKVAKVCNRMAASDGGPVDLHHAFRAEAVDVISEYAFDNCYNLLDAEDFGAGFFQTLGSFAGPFYAFVHFPFLQALAESIPLSLAPKISKDLGVVAAMQLELIRQIEVVKEKMRTGELKGSKERETLFSNLLTPDDKPSGYHVPETMQLKDEAHSILFAATDTTGNALTVGVFWILYHDDIYAKLASELKQRFPNYNKDTQIPYVELESLPYLTAVVKEVLRLSFGVPFRVPRVVPAGGAEFEGYYIPKGTVIGVSQWMLHRDPEAFPDPMKFDPERWLKGPEETRKLEKYMVPFSRGSRSCVGQNLAYAELYVTLGTFFRRFADSRLRIWGPEETKALMFDFDDYVTPHMSPDRKEDWLKVYMEKPA